MANTKKRVLSFLMAMVMVVGLLPLNALAAGDDKAEQAQKQIVEAGGVSYYKADGTQTTKQNADVAVSKTVTATGTENLFDVTVNVQYKKTTTSVGKSAYVVLVLDTSGSMGYCSACGAGYSEDGTRTFDRPAHCKECGRSRDDGNHGWFGHTYVECTETLSRMEAAKAAANAFLEGLAREGTTRYVSLVTFESNAAAKDFGRGTYWLDVSQGTNLQTVKDAVNALNPGGGTNTEGGMQLAYNLLKKNTAAVDARYVVLLSDGEPTYHLDNSNHRNDDDYNRNDTNAMRFTGTQGGGSYASYNDWKDLKGIADKITAVNDGNADMYSLLYGDTGSATCRGDRNHASTTVKALFESFNPRPATGNILQPTNANQLKDMFEGILQRTQESGASSTGMSDAGAVLETVETKAAHFWRFVRQNGAQNSGDNITWDFINNGEKDATATMGEGFTSYTMSYQIWLDTTVSDFVEGTAYELSPASVTFRNAADPNGGIHTAVTPTAKIKGYRAELSFEKVAHEDGHLLGNATFTASNLAWTDGLNGTIKAAGAWSYDATSGIDPKDDKTYGKVIFPENSIPSGYVFTLKEKTAPEGYELDPTERTFRVAYGEVVEMTPAIDENGKIENTLQQQDLDLTVKKQWRTPDDVSDKTIEVTLYQDRTFKADGSVDNAGSVYAVLHLRAGQAEKISGDGRMKVKSATVNGKDWTYVLTVDALNVETGSRHTYAVEEAAVSGFETAYDQSTLTIVNTAAGTTSVSVKKQWILPDGLVGQDVEVILYKDGKEFKRETVKGDGTVYTFENLPLYNESYTAKAHYTVGEDPASLGTGYQYLRTEGSGDAGDPYVLVNSVGNENLTVSGTKTWKTPVGFETPTITVQLFKADANGQPTGTALAELELDGNTDSPAAGNAETAPWTFCFTQDAAGNPLPKYDFEKDANGNITGVTENRYVVVEQGADNGQVMLGGNTYTVSQNGNNITNVLTGETSVTVTKTWVDLDGAEKPEVKVKLLRDGVEVDEKTLENDKAEWTGLPRYNENGLEYSYTVEEVVPEGYERTKQETKQLSDGSFQAELVNRRKIDDEKISVTVTKTWQQPGTVTAPDVEFTLWADGVKKESKTLRAGEGSLTFENLPRYKYVTVEETDGEGKVTGTHQEIEEIEYTVTEATPSGYTSVSSNETDPTNGNVSYGFTNTITGQVTLEVEKRWIDAVHTGTRPEATFKVYRVSANHARELVGTYTTTDSKWSGSFDRYDEKGQLYTYTVEELSVPGYQSDVRQVTPATAGSYTYQMTNTLNQAEIGHTVKKYWVDGGKENHPDIVLTLQQSEDGENWLDYRDADGSTVTHTLKNGETEYTFENLPQYNDDRTAAYRYRVREAAVEGYDTSYTYDAGTQITNTLKQEYTDVPISKTWVDPTGTEHPNVTFNLLANGSVVDTVTLGFRDGATKAPTNEGASLTSNTWEYTFTDLPKYDAQRNPITYTVEEVPVPGYTSARSNDGRTFINTIKQETISFTGTKTWSIPAPAEGAVDKADAVINTIWVGLYKGQAGSEVLVGTPQEVEAKNEDGETYSFTFENLDKYDLTTGEEIRYFVREGKMENGTFVPYADGATFLVSDGGIHKDYDDTYQVTYQGAKSITNTYQAPVEYYYQIVRNYKTTFGDGHDEVYSAKVDGPIETGTKNQTVTADPTQYTTQAGVEFTFVNADPADYTVTLDEANHLYVITLNYVRDLHQLTVEYQFEGYGATVPAGFEKIQTPETPVSGDGYTDPGQFNPEEAFATQAVPDEATVPAGYVLTKVTANGEDQALGDYSGAFGTGDDFRDIHVIYTYAKRSGSHPDIPASVTLSKYDNASVPALITASAATFQLYSDEACTEPISGKTYTTSNGKLTITASDEGLGAGTYYLKELTAPEGYDLSEEVFKLTVSVIPHQEWYEDTAQGGRVWVIYDEFRLKVEEKTDDGYKKVSAIDVTDALKTADYTVKYWFEQNPAAKDYRQNLTEYPDLTDTLGYFETVQAAKYELGKTGMKGIPEGYEWNHNDPDSISYDSVNKVINLYYDLKISTDKQNVSGTKTWYGTAGSAEIGLYQTVNGSEQLFAHQTVTGNASYTFENLPKYVDGHEASYEIFEIVGSDADGWTKVAEGAKVTLNGVDYQVRYTGSGLNKSVINSELGSVTVTKVFADVEDGGISYPASVEAMLYANDQQVLRDALGNAVGNAEGVLTVANNGTVYSVTVGDLPKYDAQGNAITYTVKECYTNPTTSAVQPVTDGAKITLNGVEYTVTYLGTAITNTVARGELTVVKTYTGPAELSDAFQVLVKENGQTVATLTKADAAKTGTGTDSDPYTYTWTVRNLLSGRTYTVEEAGTAVEGWTLKSAESTVSEEHVSTGATAALHNVYERNQAYLTITKTVSGLKMNEKHSFKFQVTGDNYGTAYNQTHTIEVTGNTSASTTIQVPTGSYTVTELADSAVIGSYQLTATTYTPANNGGTAAEISVTDANNTPAQAAAVTVSNVYSYDPPSGSQVTITVRKVWEDDHNRDGLRPVSITVGLFEDGKLMEGVVNTKVVPVGTGDTDTVSFTYDAYLHPGKIDVRELGYTVGEGYVDANGQPVEAGYHEGALAGYEVIYADPTSEGVYTITNTHQSEEIRIPVVKTWSGSYGTQPSKIELELYANGKATGLKLELTAQDAIGTDTRRWYGVFASQKEGTEPIRIYKNENGKAIVYTVVELSIDGVTVTGNSCGSWVVSTGTTTAGTILKTEEERALLANRLGIAIQEETTLLSVSNYFSSGGSDPDPDKPKPNPDPDPDPGTDIDDPDVPLDPGPGGDDVNIDDEDVPTTGDNFGMWVAAASVSGMALIWLALTGKKRKEEDAQN